mgnify:CR=1 FL=1
MPPRKRQQSNAMLYTLVAFVGLFIIATTFAVVYYVRAEDFRTRQTEAERALNEYVSATERQNIGSVVGAKQSGETYLGTMIEHLDRAVSLATGMVPADTTAEVKVAQLFDSVKQAINLTAPYTNLEGQDPNNVGLIRIVQSLKSKLDNTTQSETALTNQLAELQQKFDDLQAATQAMEQTLMAEKARLEEKVNQTVQDYNDLEQLLEQTATQREQNLLAQLNEQKERVDQLTQDMQRLNAQLDMTQEALNRAESQIAIVKGPPDVNVPAYRPDGRIILIDKANDVVHVSIGSDDRVYRGLTFSVYDRGQGVAQDGKPKAEIQVFDVADSFAAARIVKSEPKRPILLGDVIANVIWDGSKSNTFVIAGAFDTDNDGTVERDARDRLTGMIEQWGGRVADDITVDTDYLVLGKEPEVPEEPTFQDIEIDPQANMKYEQAKQELERYNQVQRNAQALWIPILKYQRFLYLIGNEGPISTAGAF